jgi:hypothetical protein
MTYIDCAPNPPEMKSGKNLLIVKQGRRGETYKQQSIMEKKPPTKKS